MNVELFEYNQYFTVSNKFYSNPAHLPYLLNTNIHLDSEPDQTFSFPLERSPKQNGAATAKFPTPSPPIGIGSPPLHELLSHHWYRFPPFFGGSVLVAPATLQVWNLISSILSFYQHPYPEYLLPSNISKWARTLRFSPSSRSLANDGKSQSFWTYPPFSTFLSSPSLSLSWSLIYITLQRDKWCF